MHLLGTNRANPGLGSNILHPLGYLVFQIKINLPRVTSEGTFSRPNIFVDTKNVTLPLQHQKLHGAASYFKQAKPLQASDLVIIEQKLQDLSK